MAGDSRAIELVRFALLHLYEPTELAESELARRLVERGRLRSPGGLYGLLLAELEKLKPPDLAPTDSPGQRQYSYLRLRYVDGRPHAVIAAELGLSARHAARLHQDALARLARLVAPDVAARPTAQPPRVPAGGGTEPSIRPLASSPTDREPPWLTEIDIVGRLQPDEDLDVFEVAIGVRDTLARRSDGTPGAVTVRANGPLPPARVNRVALRQILLNLLLYLLRQEEQPAGKPIARSAIQLHHAENSVLVSVGREPASAPGGALSATSEEATRLLHAAGQLACLQGVVLEPTVIDSLPVRFLLRLPTGSLRSILLVDDNPDVGELFQRMLAASPYHLTHVRTANRALQVARARPPDAIILDIVLPGHDGWEIQEALQNDAHTAQVPVIVCSVLPDRELALSLGAADFLAKPVSRPVLLACLNHVFFPRPETARETIAGSP